MPASTPTQRKQYTTAQNLTRAATALHNMPYGGIMRLPTIHNCMTPALAVQEMATALEAVRETLKGVAERHATDEAELQRLRAVIRGGREFFAELQTRTNISGGA